MPRSATSLLVGVLAAAGLAAAAAPALAGDGSVIPPNYRFGDGLEGFRLSTSHGLLLPAVLVAFDPPAPIRAEAVDMFRTTIDLTDGSRPTLFNPTEGQPFIFHFSVVGLGDSHLGAPPFPDASGFTGFRHVAGDHVFDINFQFGPGEVTSWRALDPDPGPPGNWFSVEMTFAGDPFASFSITEDGEPLQFGLAPAAGAPEPGTWALLLGGLFAMGGALRLARRGPTAA
jgi:hypothetical protein